MSRLARLKRFMMQRYYRRYPWKDPRLSEASKAAAWFKSKEGQDKFDASWKAVTRLTADLYERSRLKPEDFKRRITI